jgi:hypothetical protein
MSVFWISWTGSSIRALGDDRIVRHADVFKVGIREPTMSFLERMGWIPAKIMPG